MWTLSAIHTGRIKASVFEVDPKVLSRNAPENIGESKHFTIASSLRGQVTATRKIGPTRHFDSSPHAISPGWSATRKSRLQHGDRYRSSRLVFTDEAALRQCRSGWM